MDRVSSLWRSPLLLLCLASCAQLDNVVSPPPALTESAIFQQRNRCFRSQCQTRSSQPSGVGKHKTCSSQFQVPRAMSRNTTGQKNNNIVVNNVPLEMDVSGKPVKTLKNTLSACWKSAEAVPAVRLRPVHMWCHWFFMKTPEIFHRSTRERS